MNEQCMLRASRPGLSPTDPQGVVSVSFLPPSSWPAYPPSAGPSDRAMTTKKHNVRFLEGLLPVCFTQCLRSPWQVGSAGRNPEASEQQLLASHRLDIRATLMYFSAFSSPFSVSYFLPHLAPALSPPPPPPHLLLFTHQGWSKASACLKVGRQHQRIPETLVGGQTASENSRSSWKWMNSIRDPEALSWNESSESIYYIWLS